VPGTTRRWTGIDSPVGPLRLAAEGESVTAILFRHHDGRGAEARAAPPPERERADGDPLLRCVAVQLAEYFAGDRRVFDLPLGLRGTDFQRRVWGELLRIPYGATTSYGAVAAALGLPPGAARAVGLANGANPISIVVPCHRVVGADGSLTGYGGGLDRKRYLLDLESDSLF
jgi:methylated-DNA-[protein]-cysteine S-methyltransferase